MTVPNYSGKHDAPAIIEPMDHLAKHDLGEFSIPETVLLTYQPHFTEWVSEQADEEFEFDQGTFYVVEKPAGRLGVFGGFGIGAAVTALRVEQLAALGVETIIILGGCGGLQPDLHGEEALLITEAIRDEGVSHHYLKPAQSVEASPSLVSKLEDGFSESEVDYRTGPTWTTDAFYRETIPEVEHYADKEVLGVEMEAAALFAVGQYRGFDAGAVLVAFDALTSDEWIPKLEGERRLERVFPVVRSALLSE